MPFDQKTRNLLQRTVSACRKILDEEFSAQRREVYGINDDGTAAPLDLLAHLPDEDMQTARLLRDRLDHLTAGLTAHGKKEADARKESVGRLTRELAFTVLNRLAALRMAEERGIVLECVRNGLQSEGFLLFQQSAGGAFGDSYHSYRAYLFVLFDELAIDLGGLFNRWDPAGLLFPGSEALDAVLHELNGSGSAAARENLTPDEFNAIWSEDETIGWIYQYYNDPAERKKMRDESSAPRNSRELAVRNQFFTPRYVVEFLTDNTLGRIWYEMCRGQTRLVDQCRYLVRRPVEIFLNEGEAPPSDSENLQSSIADSQSQEELLRQPVHIPHRPLKDPREIRLLDPACGSMHFGLYAFDLFATIYEEAWDLLTAEGANSSTDHCSPITDQSGQRLTGLYTSKVAYMRDVPRLIVEHNIHGIDIDPRAAQIAGLSLWLRAQRAWHQAGIAPADRPRITRSNIVCAEPMPGKKEMLRDFVKQQFPVGERPVFQHLLEGIFEKMQLSGEAGSLLRIEEEIRSAIDEARTTLENLQSRPSELFTTAELNKSSRQPELTGLDAALQSTIRNPQSSITEGFWQAAEQRIYHALENYAAQAETSGGFQRRLFANDAARGFAFIDLCRKRYDVVVMNPPFGSEPRHLIEFIKKTYPAGRADLYACFLERAAILGEYTVRIGVLSSRTGFFLTSLESWRRSYLLGKFHLSAVADLGLGVLDDALVEAAAYVVSGSSGQNAAFISCLADYDKGQRLLFACSNYDFIEKPLTSFSELPLASIAYWVSKSISDLFSSFPPLEGNYGYARVGLQTSDDYRFLRGFWEVPIRELKSDHTATWPPMAKGGEYQLFYDDVHLVVNWRSGAKEMKAFALGHAEKTGSARGNSPLREFEFYFKGGITYPERTTSEFGPRSLPDGCITGTVGPGIHIESEAKRYYILGWLTSRVVRELIEVSIGLGDAVESGSAARHYNIKSIGRLPVPTLSTDIEAEIAQNIRANVIRCMQIWQRDEVSRIFVAPAAVRLDWKSSSRAWFDEQEEIKLLNLEAHGKAEDRFIDSLPGAEEIRNDIDSGVGLHPCDLPRCDGMKLKQIVHAYERGLEDLVNLVGSEMRFSRQITKKSFFADRRIELVALWLGCHPRQVVELRKQTQILPPGVTEELVAASLSYALGSVFGRWDIRYAAGERAAPEPPDPFAPLPVCPPGMLQGDAGLPAAPGDVPASYPVPITWSGILVDDANHPDDIERRLREVLAVIFPDRTDAIVQEACDLLGAKSLRDWFAKPTGFFADHLKRYSKSRRQAPIYWPLSTASGSYTLWIYYHRLTPDTLYKCLSDFVEPKIAEVEKEIHRLRTMIDADEAGTRERKQLADAESLLNELREFHADLSHWAPRWKPNLNDGVQITASPLWKLFRLPKWQKTLKETWQKLEKGDYDWAHLAHTLWPDRVREKCKRDRSLAIAHNHEDLCEIQAPVPKKRAAKKAAKKKAKASEEDLF